eukprot:CAMPEP_0114249334 /NCGR_PEP_ID=MMETSP0058-20121206/14085_1 /TAXON_ID=36894 /ORGANISM="Pyramimonas parkeae, CCMP726" /LENGTH=585 /DNA_ID=CAMNT_0001362869 /DNA_START=209 /DNA_END=1966 /DNA_ORIENTATION=-
MILCRSGTTSKAFAGRIRGAGSPGSCPTGKCLKQTVCHQEESGSGRQHVVGGMNPVARTSRNFRTTSVECSYKMEVPTVSMDPPRAGVREGGASTSNSISVGSNSISVGSNRSRVSNNMHRARVSQNPADAQAESAAGAAADAMTEASGARGEVHVRKDRRPVNLGLGDPLDYLVSILMMQTRGRNMEVGPVLQGEEMTVRKLTTLLKKLRLRGAAPSLLMRVYQWAKQEMRLNVFHYNALIAALARSDFARALVVFGDMRAARVPPDAYTFNTLLDACARQGSVAHAKEVYLEMQAAGVDPDVFTFNTLIQAYSHAGDWRGALDTCGLIREHGVLPDVVTFSTVITSCEKAEQPTRAMEVYRDMSALGVTPNEYTFSSLISVCQRQKDWEGAIALFEDMKKAKVAPNHVTYSALISACGEGKQMRKALSVFEEMKGSGVRPNAYTFNALITACEKSGHWYTALRVYEDMKKQSSIDPSVTPDIVTATAVIKACKRAIGGVPWIERSDIMNDMHVQSANRKAGSTKLSDVGEGDVREGDAFEIYADRVYPQQLYFEDTDDLEMHVEELLRLAMTIGHWPKDLMIG